MAKDKEYTDRTLAEMKAGAEALKVRGPQAMARARAQAEAEAAEQAKVDAVAIKPKG